MARARKIEAELRVLGGFPVLVRAIACPAEPDVGLMSGWVDDIQVLTLKGKPADFITDRMTKRDWDRLAEDLCEAA